MCRNHSSQSISPPPCWVLCSGEYIPKEINKSHIFILIYGGTVFPKVPGRAGMETLYGIRG